MLNYLVFYVVIGNVMEVRTLVYSRRNLPDIIWIAKHWAGGKPPALFLSMGGFTDDLCQLAKTRSDLLLVDDSIDAWTPQRRTSWSEWLTRYGGRAIPCPVSACKLCFCIPRAVQRSAERSVHPGNPKLCLCDNWFFRLNVYSQGLIHRQSSFGICSLQPPFDAHWDTMEDVCKNERNAWCCAIDYGITIALWNCK